MDIKIYRTMIGDLIEDGHRNSFTGDDQDLVGTINVPDTAKPVMRESSTGEPLLEVLADNGVITTFTAYEATTGAVGHCVDGAKYRSN